MNTYRYFYLSNFFALSLLVASVFLAPSSICFAKDSATVQIIKIKDYKSQDEIRDSIRFALCRVSNSNLSFWGREYPINEDFYNSGDVSKISVIKDHPDLLYKLWIQEKKSPLVIILPGMGSHFQGMGLNAMAQVYYDAGCSVVIISSAMNWEFYMAASRSKAPGYIPTDVEDIYSALSKIVTKVKSNYPKRVKSVHLVGYSLGGLHTLFLAERESRSKKKIGFKSYLSIHPPVDPYTSMYIIDKFFKRGSDWSEKEMKLKIERSVAGYLKLIDGGLSESKVKILKEEGEVLIAYAYRSSLRELLMAICKVGNDMGIIKEKYGFIKGALYKELNRYSFAKYADLFVKKAVSERSGRALSMKEMAANSNLHSIAEFLKKADNISLIHSLDDFLINKNDVIWFSRVFGERAYFLRYGGHLGELYTPEAKRAIVKHLNLVMGQ